MWFLWVFGLNIEMRLGTFRFLLFYILWHCRISSFALSADVVVIGASASIAGLLGGYLVLFPKNKTKGTFPSNLLTISGLYFYMVFVSNFSVSQMNISTAYLAHIRGFIAGIILIKRYD